MTKKHTEWDIGALWWTNYEVASHIIGPIYTCQNPDVSEYTFVCTSPRHITNLIVICLDFHGQDQVHVPAQV